MERIADCAVNIAEEFAERFGRRHPAVEAYRCDDAEIVLLMMGSFATKARDAVDALREAGWRIGLARIRLLRPLPGHRWLACLPLFHVAGLAIITRVTRWGAPLDLLDHFEAAAVITTLVLLGQVLELRARSQTNAAIRMLLGLAPNTARIVREDGHEQDIPLQQVQAGDILRVRPGEKIPVDGVVTNGHSAVDESMVTFLPIFQLGCFRAS